jgi:hypothetical protein
MADFASFNTWQIQSVISCVLVANIKCPFTANSFDNGTTRPALARQRLVSRLLIAGHGVSGLSAERGEPQDDEQGVESS